MGRRDTCEQGGRFFEVALDEIHPLVQLYRRAPPAVVGPGLLVRMAMYAGFWAMLRKLATDAQATPPALV